MATARGMYRGIYCSLVDSVEFQQLSKWARLVFLTARLSNQAGIGCIFRYYPDMIAQQTGLKRGKVEAAVRELVTAGWAELEDGILWIINGLKYDPTMRLSNPNHKKAIITSLHTLPRRPIVARFCKYYGLRWHPLSHPDGMGDGTQHPIPYPVEDLEAMQEYIESKAVQENQQQSPAFAGETTDVLLAVADGIGDGTPSGRPVAALTAEAWEAYAGAYKRRYGALPVRNAKVNSQLALLAKRLPRAELAAVAAYYVAHSGQRYVRAGHPIGLLLYDAEKLRTEWATGRRITETGARQADQRAERGGIAERLIAKAQQDS